VQVDVALPAIGFIATESNADLVATSARQAHERGHAVFVVPVDDDLLGDRMVIPNGNENIPENGGVLLQERDDDMQFAHVLSQHRRTQDAEESSTRAVLAAAAESHSLPGIVFYGAINERPDFERIPGAESSEFVIDAIASPRTQQSLLVAIPAYNEAGDIGDVVREVRQYAESVLVVDDGSTDGTADRARAAGAIVVRHHRNQGYGGALQTIFREAAERGFERLVTIDADGQHEPSDIPRLVECQWETDAEIVIGSRLVEGALTDVSPYRRVGLRVVNWLANLSIGLISADSRVQDTQSGFRAYDRSAIESLADDSVIDSGMGASTDILYHACHSGYRIEEVPTTVYYHVENASTHNPFVHGFGLVRNLLRTIEYDRPLSVLVAPGFVLTLSGVVLGSWTMARFVETGAFLFGRALLAGVLGTVGALVSVVGIVLYALNTHQKHP